MINSSDTTLSSIDNEDCNLSKNLFSKEEDRKLIKLVGKYKEKNWKKIASHFENKTYVQCFSRYKRIKPGISRGFWKKEEDELLLSYFKKYGKKWAKIAKEIKTRTGKQVRDRFINVLDPLLNKGPFTREEDLKIAELYVLYGTKWAKIAKECGTKRSPDLIKNRFYSRLKDSAKKIQEEKNKKISSNENINKGESEDFQLFYSINDNYFESTLSYDFNFSDIPEIKINEENVSFEDMIFFEPKLFI